MSSATLLALRCSCRCIKYVHFLKFSSEPGRQIKKNPGKVVNVAILGAPNSGKSTLINRIIDRKICAASNKVHTTTSLARAICYENETQIIFLDTPGVITEKEQKRYKLPLAMIGACEKSLNCADVVGVVHDVSNRWTKDQIHRDVINLISTAKNLPSFLILNKVDKLKSKRQLLSTIRNLTNGFIAGKPIAGKFDRDGGKNKLEKGYSKFSDVFLVSALTGDGVDAIKEYLISNARAVNLQYSPDEWTDQTPETLIEEAVRAKFLDFLAQEIPYSLKTFLEYYDENIEENKIVCSVAVECPSERVARLINGAGGGRLQQMKSSVRSDLMDLFKKAVVIDLTLKVRNKELEELKQG